METRLPIPKNWQDFEMLCHQLWKDIWADPNAQRNGRHGQAQHGVDIWGRPAYRAWYAGVQCKDKDAKLGSELTSNELENECENAKEFRPEIRVFSMATTAARDGKLQEHARALTDERKFPFDVNVWAWDDIEEEIRCRPGLVAAYYPGVEISGEDAAAVTLSPMAKNDHFYAFFSRPAVAARIPGGLKNYLLSLCYELSDNAYLHGKATQFQIKCEERRIVLQDNGVPFDPTERLEAERASNKSHVGSYVFAAFCREFSDRLTVVYELRREQESEFNTIIIEADQPIASLAFDEPAEVVIDLSGAKGRAGAARLAEAVTLPASSPELVLQFGDVRNLSALVEFISYVLARLPADRRLVVYLPSFGLLRPIGRWFKDERLSVRFR